LEFYRKNDEPEVSNMEDPQVGMDWIDPNCMTCKFNKNGYCKRYGCNRMEVPVDIYDCPSYEPDGEDERREAFRIMNVDGGGNGK